MKRWEINFDSGWQKYEWFLFSWSFSLFCELGLGVGGKEHEVITKHTKCGEYTKIKFETNTKTTCWGYWCLTEKHIYDNHNQRNEALVQSHKSQTGFVVRSHIHMEIEKEKTHPQNPPTHQTPRPHESWTNVWKIKSYGVTRSVFHPPLPRPQGTRRPCPASSSNNAGTRRAAGPAPPSTESPGLRARGFPKTHQRARRHRPQFHTSTPPEWHSRCGPVRGAAQVSADCGGGQHQPRSVRRS